MSLYKDAAAGSLTAAALDGYLKTGKVDECSTETGSGTLGLTPLALAARGGHVEVVRLLLNKGAKADGLSTKQRTPLWIVTSRGRGDGRLEIVGLLLEHKANAKYSHPSLNNGSTPLVNELNQLRDLDVIELLVQANGKTDEAMTLAAALGDPAISDALQSTQERSKLRDTIVGLVVAFILFIVAWANSPAVTGMVNKVFNKFQMSGNKDSSVAKKIAKEVPEPKTKEDFKESANAFIHKHKLDTFFPTSDNPLLETLVSKAVDLQNDDTSVLGQSTNTENLVKFALYQPVIYCDDSGSMSPEINSQKEDRWADQGNLARRIASICTEVVPDTIGVHLRFINKKLPEANNLRMDAIEKIMSQTQPSGSTEIGTNLRTQILDPLVYKTKMTRPLFVSIITDGIPGGQEPSPERRDTLRNEIIQCQNWLLKKGLPPRAVIFQVSQIGSDPGSKDFLDGLAKDQRLSSVYVTTQQLDAKFRELRGKERDLEAWLFQTLLNPIVGIGSG
ncbi:ankyrin repeat protein [Thozetella sp. PMI_491]|nr:ankyrin repeat protein [Thozetella sp. PMI_491]